ncbi:magnesium transporter CorA family protein [Hathewaya histolytica]|uniref:Transporter, CorA metal ion transporter family n=1 Tax=Hathewaya histolytica TaxID=1498 RepID=A0A4U9QUS3_HATHI|nr:magnesium transporter CorA family protein [Hathewaya histolytica]VTQ82406.1 transporter, CorA metal ion transporter family [Hathewaya histolytica]
MIKIYKNTEEENKVVEIESVENGCWINMVRPSLDELSVISQRTKIPVDMLKAALDEEETSRLEIDEGNRLVILDIPFENEEDESMLHDTYPLGIVSNDSVIVTVCLKESKILDDFVIGRIKSFYTYKRSRFILQILYRIASYYLIYLRQIDKKSVVIENRLHKSMRNRELIQLLSLEKSLVYFSTSLKSNEITLEKMLKMNAFVKYEEDQDILEDVIIENKQAIEMANIYSNILSGTMDAFASVISNNLNIVMKFLASITIVMAIPSIFSGFFGMNVNGIPYANSANGFFIVVCMSIVVCALVTFFLNKKDMF